MAAFQDGGNEHGITGSFTDCATGGKQERTEGSDSVQRRNYRWDLWFCGESQAEVIMSGN